MTAPRRHTLSSACFPALIVAVAVRGRLSVKFFDIVNQAIALLQNAERISHRALKREFDLTQETVWRLLSKGLKYGTI